MIPLCVPNLGPGESAKLQECLASTFVSSVGPFVEEFERRIAAYTGAAHAVACASGTAAITLALKAAGVGPGDLVLCSDVTFIASANPIRHLGADVVAIDSEERSWNLDPELVERAITTLIAEGRKPKALVAVHVYGQPCDLGPILDCCAKHGVAVVEDAAESLGARWTSAYPHAACKGRHTGTAARLGCLSFNGNKLITCGGGGMVLTDDATLAKRIKHWSTQAKLPGAAFIHDEVGYNFRLTNLAAALGLAQLDRIDDLLKAKRTIWERYRSVPGLQLQPDLPHTISSRWMPTAIVPANTRDPLMTGLEARGIMARPCWSPLHRQPAYEGIRVFEQGVGRRLAERAISLPCSTGLKADDLERVANTVGKMLAETGQYPSVQAAV